MLVVAAAILAMQSSTPDAALFEKWGKETLATIRKEFYMPKKKLYADALTPGQPLTQVSFNWGVGVQLSALNAAARADKKYDPWLREFADASRSYWNTKGPVPGYDVLPGPKDVDRYYDDNQWMVMSLVETYEHLHDKKYLDWATDALTYVLSGESPALGGGIYWKETQKTSKNACSNAPAAAACLAVFQHTQNPALLKKAVDLYAWTKKNLRNPATGLIWDSMNLRGRIEKTEWSYNTALMIRTASKLYGITHLQSYADDALAFEKTSMAKWIVNGHFTDPGRFAHLLLESWFIRRQEIPVDQPLDSAITALANLHESGKSPLGLYPDRWNAPAPKGKVELIDQASVARADFEMAEYLRRK